MHLRICLLIAFGAVALSGCNAATEKEQPSSKDRTTVGTSYNSYLDDDIYLDDQEDIEGSGRGGGEVRDDLEASGSGIGPDDEDGDDGTAFNNQNRIAPVPNKVEPKTILEETIIKEKQPSVETVNRAESPVDVAETPSEYDHPEDPDENNEVLITNPKHEDRTSSFSAQSGVLAAVIGGAVVGLLCAILVVMFIVYRMRKKDEGSYALDEPRRSPAAQAYPKPGAPHHNREFYA